MKSLYTTLYVNNVIEAVSFYEKIFGLTRRFFHRSGQYAEIKIGSTVLAFVPNELGQSSQQNNPVEVILIVEDVKGVYNRAVSEGAGAVVSPHVKPWGQEVAYVRDLYGVLVEIAGSNIGSPLCSKSHSSLADNPSPVSTSAGEGLHAGPGETGSRRNMSADSSSSLITPSSKIME